MSYKIGVIVGSTRPNRVGIKVGEWYVKRAAEFTEELEFELIDLKEVNLPFLDEPKPASSGEYTKDHTKAWSEKIKQYDGYVLVTAEYNHGPPAPLKNALDFLASEWNKKPMAFVGYGGVGGARAVSMLRVIASELGAAPIWSGVHIRAPREAVTDDGVDESFINGPVERQVNELVWWTKALADARNKQ